MQKTFFLIFNILIIISFCTSKPKALPEPKSKPFPKAEPKANPNPKAKSQYLFNGPTIWYRNSNGGTNKIGFSMDVTERLRLQSHLQILQDLIATGRISTARLENFIETADVRDVGPTEVEAGLGEAAMQPCQWKCHEICHG